MATVRALFTLPILELLLLDEYEASCSVQRELGMRLVNLNICQSSTSSSIQTPEMNMKKSGSKLLEHQVYCGKDSSEERELGMRLVNLNIRQSSISSSIQTPEMNMKKSGSKLLEHQVYCGKDSSEERELGMRLVNLNIRQSSISSSIQTPEMNMKKSGSKLLEHQVYCGKDSSEERELGMRLVNLNIRQSSISSSIQTPEMNMKKSGSKLLEHQVYCGKHSSEEREFDYASNYLSNVLIKNCSCWMNMKTSGSKLQHLVYCEKLCLEQRDLKYRKKGSLLVRFYKRVGQLKGHMLSSEKLVVKPDMLFGKRGLVALNLDMAEVAVFVKEQLGKEAVETFVEMGGCKGPITTFIVEPFVPQHEEFYLNIASERLGCSASFSECRGIEIEENWDKVKTIFVLTGVAFTSETCAPLVATLPLEIKGEIEEFIKQVFALFLDMDFTFMEMNPFTLVNGKPCPLDMRGELDDTTAFKNFKNVVIKVFFYFVGGNIEFPMPFGRVMSPTKNFIHGLDEKVQIDASLLPSISVFTH
ncbi:hypothetical protein RHSIM_Rhsim06G0118800 [Rhododendron simsii]|uniref:ATP-citrate synthase ATP-grasp domain-containing protein n=1 Tax=Rhododendron simsii TaxID=118357 RepID=A0A834GWL5_RHOSS|nr:hypothetical protein RHSIM_Rhsim06G0118800 [Rhododendron simsii]